MHSSRKWRGNPNAGAWQRWLTAAVFLALSCAPLALGATLTSLTYGSPARTMGTTLAGINTIPQVGDTQVTYGGTLGNAKWVSLVDATLNVVNNIAVPCDKAVASVVADSTHSGSVQAAAGTKVITIPQYFLLDSSKTYAVCYAETDGTATDATWTDST